MIRKFIDYFIERHLLTNLIFIGVFLGGVISLQKIKKEEMPDVTFDTVRISASYSGATAEEVEHFVTKPLEDAVKGIDGIYRITSSASQGTTSISVELDKDFPKKDETITEIRNAVLDADLPDDIRDDPSVRVFETSKKAIIDVAIIHTGVHLLDAETRILLQQYAHALENQLLNLTEVNSVNTSGYLQEEIQIKVDPEKLIQYTIPLSQVISETRNNHIRQPAGSIEAKNEPKVTLYAPLDEIDKLEELIIQAGFEGNAIPLKEVATVEKEFNKSKEITKINGHEGVVLNVVKNSRYGILASLDSVVAAVKRFEENNLKGTPIQVVVLDDESIDVRNRLSIISINGAIGFVLILITLFIFLNKRSGIWVGLGIPFTMCFTLMVSYWLGYTINNTTLAAVIIVMGIVVDDAIVVAENIGRLRSQGYSSRDASVEGTAQMFLPVMASIITTCIAFIPLFFFSGRYGQINAFIPPIIFLMLGASLFESLVILPGHMVFEAPKLKDILSKMSGKKKALSGHWFDRVENAYGRVLEKFLRFKLFVFVGFVILLLFSGWIMMSKMKFVMFPDEETREISLSAYGPENADRYETAALTQKVEAIINRHLGKEVIGYRTEIARSRRGGSVEENRFRMRIEIVPKEERKMSANQLSAVWKEEIEKIEGLRKLVLQKNFWGQDSGSPIAIVIQENQDGLRESAATQLADLMKVHPALMNIEIERPLKIEEYKISLQREKVKRLSINPTDIASVFRASLDGIVLYELPKGDEEVDVRLSVKDSIKGDIGTILDIPVGNRSDYLVPLRDVITVEETHTPNSIERREFKRTTTVYADINPKAKKTPLEIAEDLELNAFPQIIKKQPTTTISFIGEVQDTRESTGDLKNAIIFVILLIFSILAVLFNSLMRPFIILLAIPFGVIGVIIAFWLHGKLLFGFFAAIGALGMAGVVVNDSIIMIDKLDKEFKPKDRENKERQIASIVQTRLRAVFLTTLTTVAGVLPTAYGFAGYDAMLSDMMLALSWGLCFGTLITLIFTPCAYSFLWDIQYKQKRDVNHEETIAP